MRVVSLFSGAGGLDLGFRRAGFDLVWANDHDPDAAATYARNLGAHIVREDITKLAARDIPDCDVVIGGFPCQGFSRANLLRSAADNRNVLYLEFLRVLRVKRPSYFVAENVRGLLSLDGGQVFRMVLDDFASTGYEVDYRVLNLADFGVPQCRHRVFLVGTRKDLDSRPGWPEPSHARPGLAGGRLRPWVSVSEALEGIGEPGRDPKMANHICSQYKVTDRNFTGHRRTDPAKPSPTVLARGNGKGGVCALMHPLNHRRISVRESARIQTFPDSFVFLGGLNSMYRQVGNAVPPLFAQKLASSIRATIAGGVLA